MSATLMVQGASSSVGKSVLVAALCRIFARRGIRVAPFKGQNMSNNAAVCADGSEIGRSQALQAAAACVAPVADMNPVLLKPEADARSQVIVHGRPWRTLEARQYWNHRDALWPVVTESLDRLRSDFELVVIEGAGSPAELNLRGRDLVNMAVARYCGAPISLVGDIDRGGIFAQLLGTLSLLEEDDRRLVRGLVVNRFRGDPTLFDSGVEILSERSGLPVLGTIPWLPHLNLPEEDSQPLESAEGAWQSDKVRSGTQERDVQIAVILLPRIANFDDFDPLASRTGVQLRYVTSPHQLGHPDAVIIPGTKSTISDLQWLRETGLATCIQQLAANGVTIVGICGGYQMLGQEIADPAGVESPCKRVRGLGLLPSTTEYSLTKSTHLVRAVIQDDRHCPGCRGTEIEGYEIHMGHSAAPSGWLKIVERGRHDVSLPDGTVSENGRIWGSYVHGLFANESFCTAWLRTFAAAGGKARDGSSSASSGVRGRGAETLDAYLDRWADHVERSLDMKRLAQIVWSNKEHPACLTT